MSRWVIRQCADRDLDEHLVFLARQSHGLANRFLDAFEQTVRRLAETPDRGFPWESTEIRVWSVRGFGNHLVFYRLIDDGIEIIRVLHAARDIGSLLDVES